MTFKTLFKTGLIATFIATAVLGTATDAGVIIKLKTHTDAIEMMGQKMPEVDGVVTTWVTDGKVRTDYGDTASMIVIEDSETMYVLNHNSKTYQEMNLGDMMHLLDEAIKDEGDEATREAMEAAKSMMKMEATVTPTDETKEIGGYKCKKYIVELQMGQMGGSTSEQWVTEEIKVDAGMYRMSTMVSLMQVPGYEDVFKELADIEGFSVVTYTTARMMGAEVKSQQELVEVKEQELEDADFAIPEGYAKK